MPLLPKSVTPLKHGRIEKPTRTDAKVVETCRSPKESDTLEIDFAHNGPPSFMWRDQLCLLLLLLLPVGMCWGGGRSEVSVTVREGETWGERDVEPRALKYLSIRIQYGVSHTVLSSPQHLVSFLPIGWSVAFLNDSSQENKCSWLPFKFMCITNTNCLVQLTGRCGFCFDFLFQYNNESISKHQ